MLELFAARVSAPCKKLIESIQLDIVPNSASAKREWNGMLSDYLVQTFPNLKNLNIHIDLGNYSSIWPVRKDSDGIWMRGFFSLHSPSLKTATVTIRDHGRDYPHGPRDNDCWRFREKPLWATHMTNCFLSPKDDHGPPEV